MCEENDSASQLVQMRLLRRLDALIKAGSEPIEHDHLTFPIDDAAVVATIACTTKR